MKNTQQLIFRISRTKIDRKT